MHYWGVGLLVFCSTVTTFAAHGASWHWRDVDRVVVFGDVHGAFGAMQRLLLAADVIDESGHWNGGQTHLVSLGDLLDRGPDSRQALELLKRLQTEASTAGGRVHLVLGNHELMNLTGDLRYVSKGEWHAFAGADDQALRAAFEEHVLETTGAASDLALPKGYFGLREAFAPDGVYGTWLLTQPAVIAINDMAFVHGGLSTDMIGYGGLQVNAMLGKELLELTTLGRQLIADHVLPVNADLLQVRRSFTEDTQPAEAAFARLVELADNPIYHDVGPFWYRGNSLCHPLLEQDGLEKTLASMNVDRVAVGHSPTRLRRPTTRLDGRVMMLDTGMLASYYQGKGYALVIEGDSEYLVDEDGVKSDPRSSAPMVNPAATPDEYLERMLANARYEPLDDEGLYQLELDGQRLRARFVPGSARLNRLEVAAYRTDRLVGLEMVPVTVAREIDGKKGVLLPEHSNWITDATRATTGQGRSNWCRTGHAYTLVSAFDNLIFNAGRNVERFWHDPATARIRLTHHRQAFGTTTRLAPLDPPPRLPPAFRARLAALTPDALEAFLPVRQARALLNRRDMMLREWRTEEIP